MILILDQIANIFNGVSVENGRREYEEIITKRILDCRPKDDRYVRRPLIDGYLKSLSSFVQ